MPKKQTPPPTARELARQLDDEGFVVLAGSVGFMNVEAADGAELTDLLFYVRDTKKVRVILVREDDEGEPHLKVQKAAADLTRWHDRIERGLPIALK